MAARWRAAEDELLVLLYGRGVGLRDIAQKLGRSPDAVASRRVLLGIPSRRSIREWTPAQDALIRAAAAAGVPSAALARQLEIPDAAIRKRRTTLLGPRPAAPRYALAEDDAIRACWASHGDVRELARSLGRSREGIRLRAGALGLRSPARRTHWSQAEDSALRAGYAQGLSCLEIQRRVLPGRTAQAITARAGKLGLTNYARRWTESEEQRLVTLGRTAPLERVALALTRTPEAIRQRARKLNIDAPRAAEHARAGRPWTPAEDALLRAHPGAHPSTLVRALQRSDRAVRRRIAALGLRAERTRSPHHAPIESTAFSPAEDRLLRRELARAPGAPRLLAISRRLQRTPGELKRRAASDLREPPAGRQATHRAPPPRTRRPDAV